MSRLRELAAAPVLGIFEASITTALQLLDPDFSKRETFGIVSTEKVWEGLLGRAVRGFLGSKQGTGGERFAGVETTGLSATELHGAPREEVRRRVKEAVGRLVRKGEGEVKVVVLGCAGMVGMEGWVREEVGEEVRVVDGVVAGVVAGVGALVGLVKGDFDVGGRGEWGRGLSLLAMGS